MEGVKIAAVLEGSDAIGALRKCGVPFLVERFEIEPYSDFSAK